MNKQQCDVYDLIFEGSVDSVSACQDGYSEAYFTLTGLYKGHSEEHLALRFDCSSDCQMSFSPGERWIIYAQYYKYGKAQANFCSRSRKKTDAGEDYFEALNHMTYAAEITFLKDTFGVQKVSVRENTAAAERKLIQPTAYWKLWLLLISMIVLYIIFYLVKKMP
ncbi:MAG TPA: hypothetical protein VGO45_05180 [Bacteroidia bacterium]|nr:hypothetical protein [Bacteroidia bacterium]